MSIRNKARHYAAANLRTGRHSTGVVDLRRGVTTIAAPHGRNNNGRWILDVESARVRGITVVLEPKRQRYSPHNNYSYSQNHKHDKYNNRRGDRGYGDHTGYRQWRRY
ncbi:MAG: hypothetical protein GXP16_19330 [Gammaproteobacteria bacterium]|nr:hypothetical protein [Gammaproteobacteria bacterium]